jgi:BirA family biotin operon repressor/biotin-[acetyl-CoA-carboxylase] ligase
LTAAALAVTLEEHLGLRVSIKWPNDLIYDKKKLIGILTELSAEMEAINYVVIGVGINISVPRACLPEEIKDKAASLNEFTDKPVGRVRLLAAFLRELERMYDKTEREGFGDALKYWRVYSAVLGCQVRVVAPDKTFVGEAVDIDDTGALLVRRADGAIERVLAGDVSVRALDGGYI